MSSINAATISTLVNAISGGLTAGQTYDLVRKISEDLDDVFSTVNSGPLKAVDGSALLHINPKNIDSPGDSPQLITDPGPVAFTNWANIFLQDQVIKRADGVSLLVVDGNAGTQRGFIGQSNGANAYHSHNMYLFGGVWQVDGAPPASMLFQTAGKNVFYSHNGAVLSPPLFTITPNIGSYFGPVPSVTLMGLYDVALLNESYIRGSNVAGNNNLGMIRVNANDVVELGPDANSGARIGHIVIPQKTTANMPPAAAASDGIIAIDKTTNKLCYWVGGVRYALAIGVAF